MTPKARHFKISHEQRFYKQLNKYLNFFERILGNFTFNALINQIVRMKKEGTLK